MTYMRARGFNGLVPCCRFRKECGPGHVRIVTPSFSLLFFSLVPTVDALYFGALYCGPVSIFKEKNTS